MLSQQPEVRLRGPGGSTPPGVSRLFRLRGDIEVPPSRETLPARKASVNFLPSPISAFDVLLEDEDSEQLTVPAVTRLCRGRMRCSRCKSTNCDHVFATFTYAQKFPKESDVFLSAAETTGVVDMGGRGGRRRWE